MCACAEVRDGEIMYCKECVGSYVLGFERRSIKATRNIVDRHCRSALHTIDAALSQVVIARTHAHLWTSHAKAMCLHEVMPG